MEAAPNQPSGTPTTQVAVPPDADAIELYGRLWRGTLRDHVGVFNNDMHGGSTYSGHVKDGIGDGYGVIKWSDGRAFSGQFAAGKDHGYGVARSADGEAVGYSLFEHDAQAHYARVLAGGASTFDYAACGADHAGLVALKAAALTVAD
jgi:hypothetical protein